MEGMALCMALAWVFKLLHTGRVQVVHTPLNLPILLFIGLIGLQLLPLPPIVLYVISPHTYGFYQQTLAGWPDRDPCPWCHGMLYPSNPKHSRRIMLSLSPPRSRG